MINEYYSLMQLIVNVLCSYFINFNSFLNITNIIIFTFDINI